jgi:hypothetical protein
MEPYAADLRNPSDVSCQAFPSGERSQKRIDNRNFLSLITYCERTVGDVRL